ncbi:hypothetical protein [Pseudomonas asplenii]|uniref:hypothetical protein n=1 Tax=Pseudomonas asplenii TaxID=53407 RepID=UPI00031F6726|nr:hypothetical protein [Pseudomonas fuscovaginae]
MERPSRLRHLACLLLSLAPLVQAAEAPIDCAALDTKAAASSSATTWAATRSRKTRQNSKPLSA